MLLLTDRRPRPRTWPGEAWRLAVTMLAGVVSFGFSMDTESQYPHPPGDDIYGPDFGLMLLSWPILLLRRRFPLPVAVLLALFTCVSAGAGPAAAVALLSLSTHRRPLPIAVASVVSLASSYAFERIRPTQVEPMPMPLTLVFTAALIAVVVAIGYAIGSRRELMASLRARAEMSDREQSARVDQARATERSRIAREMHDVVAHRMSIVAMHSGALAYREDLSPAETRAAAEVIRDNAHQALSELRQALGVLRDTGTADDGAPEPPQPTLAGLSALVETEEAAGARITAHLDAPIQAMPDALSRNAFRIVQEALTNARKHAPGQPVDLRISGRAGDWLDIEARNPAATATAAAPRGDAGPEAPALPASGLGLLGLTERAIIAGGQLSFGRDRAGDFVVRARLPWHP
ncbi:MAG: histidine kinase [Micrococcales bacterium]|nr:histidine kinase [Micrococcales bacterium]